MMDYKQVKKEHDFELLMDYFDNYNEELYPEFKANLDKHKIESVENEEIANLPFVCLWADYLIVRETGRVAGPLSRIVNYVLKREKKDFLVQIKEKYGRLDFTKDEEQSIREEWTHAYVLAVNQLANHSLFEHGLSLRTKIDTYALSRFLSTSKVLESVKPDDTLISIFTNAKDKLVVMIDYDLGPAGRSHVGSIIVDDKLKAEFSPSRGYSFEGDSEKKYVDTCIKKMIKKIEFYPQYKKLAA